MGLNPRKTYALGITESIYKVSSEGGMYSVDLNRIELAARLSVVLKGVRTEAETK